MKKLFFAVMMCSFVMNVSAQRLDIDKAWFDYFYRRLPNLVIDASFKTYSVNITKTVALDAYSNESANGLISIEGKKKVASPAHLNVYINLSDLIIEKSEVVERVEVQKDKDGKETGRSYYYHVNVIYSFDASAEVKDPKGTVLSNYRMARRDSKQQFNTAEVGKSSDAANYYNNNSLEIKTRLVSEQITSAMQSLNASLNNDFGYKVIKTREFLWTLGSEKHPEFKSFQEACNTGRSAMEIITADLVAEDVQAKMQPAIEYFMEIDKKYTNTEEKAEKKLRYGAYFNLAELYMFSEQFDKAKEYAQKLVDNDFDPKDGERIIKEIDSIIADLKKHNASTRHFVPDLENIQMPM
jgi:hypothetical protein